MADTKRTQKTQQKTRRGRTTRQGGRRTTRRRPKWLPDDEPEPVKAEAAPEQTEAPARAAPAPTRPSWGAADWVSVRYDGPDWFVHPRAGVFVPGTTTRLRGELARQLPEQGFRFTVEALRRAG